MRYAFEPDATQQSLLPYLQRTEELLTRATTSLSARSQPARITAMPDLGLPHNVTFRLSQLTSRSICVAWLCSS